MAIVTGAAAARGAEQQSAGKTPAGAQTTEHPRSVVEDIRAADGGSVFSRAELSPGRVVAGDSDEFVIKLTIGPAFTKSPSRLVVDFPGVMGQSRVSLWHNEDHGWVEVYISNPDVTYVKKLWDIEIGAVPTKDKGSWRGMAQRMLILNLSDGVKEGDTIEIRWGDCQTQRGFAVGCKNCTVLPVRDYRQTIHVRYFDDPEAGLPDYARSYKGYDRPAPVCDVGLSFAVEPRPLHHVRLVRKCDKAILVPHDVFWNVVPVKEATELVDCRDAVQRQPSDVFHYGDKNVQVRPRRVPLLDCPPMDNVFEGMNIYWGDLHHHSVFSNDVIERERMELTPDETFWYARHRGCLDFAGISDHHQPWDVERNKIGAAHWARTAELACNHTAAGAFLAFAGFEFRCPRGDTVFVFKDSPDYAEIDRPDWKDVRLAWEGLKGKDFISIPHYHNGGSLPRGQWWENIETGVETVIEIFSCHGSYERADALEQNIAMMKSARQDRTAEFFIKTGRKYGLVCNSDSHKGHPGINGITAVYSRSLDKDSIFEAYSKRHVYGSTSARIRLLFTGNGRLMGSVIPNTDEKNLLIDVAGENMLKKVDLFRNGEHHKRFYPGGPQFKTEYVVRESQPSNWYVRATQVDNQIAYSSPVWFT